MSYIGYVLAGWLSTFLAFATYIFFVLRRGRSYSAKVPEARRRWIDSGSENKGSNND